MLFMFKLQIDCEHWKVCSHKDLDEHHQGHNIPYLSLQRFLHTMRAIQGALIASSSLQIILGYSQLWGIFSRYVTTLLALKHFINLFMCDV